MTKYSEVRRWRTGPLDEAERSLAKCAEQIEEIRSGLLATKLFEAWKSPAAEGAANAERGLVTELDRLGEAFKQARKAVMDASDAVEDLQTDIKEAESMARHHGLKIKADGSVTVMPSHIKDIALLIALVSPELTKVREKAEVERQVRAIMEKAEKIDEDCAMLFGRAAATTHGNDLHTTLLSGFTVPVDRRDRGLAGTLLTWASGGDTEDGSAVNKSEADLLAGDPEKLWKANGIRGRATDEALERYGEEGSVDGRTDAFRHAYANALMARDLGDRYATDLSTAHEQSDGYDAAKSMDLYNNEIGRTIAAENPGATDEQLARKVSEALERGDLVIMSDSGELTRSDGTTGNPGAPGVERPEQVRPEPWPEALYDKAVDKLGEMVTDGVFEAKEGVDDVIDGVRDGLRRLTD